MVLGAVSIALALILVILFFKVYKTQRSIFLLGLPFGFLFLSLSYLFLGAHLVLPYEQTLSGSLMWLRVITQTGGFLLIALSYYLSNRSQNQKKSRYSFATISLFLVISVTILFCLLVIINPSGLTSVYILNDYFTVANLCLLGYIIIFLTLKFMHSNRARTLVSAPIAFTLLWIGQLMFLVWDVGSSEIPLLSSQIVRIAALAIFIEIYYLAIREAPASDCG
jgi:hypothetical protein